MGCSASNLNSIAILCSIRLFFIDAFDNRIKYESDTKLLRSFKHVSREQICFSVDIDVKPTCIREERFMCDDREQLKKVIKWNLNPYWLPVKSRTARLESSFSCLLKFILVVFPERNFICCYTTIFYSTSDGDHCLTLSPLYRSSSYYSYFPSDIFFNKCKRL